MAKKDISYKDAIKQVEIIIQKIENEELDVDELTGQIKKASELLSVCKKKLRNTEKEIEKIISEIDMNDKILSEED
ncbi:MAG: exodeoxyribonuclease VII small subunit [Bacteroidota bacterium]